MASQQDKTAALYLLPSTLGSSALSAVLPPFNLDTIANIRHYVVEDIRSARRFLSKAGWQGRIDELHFQTLNEHTSEEEKQQLLHPITQHGHSIGLISEAGLPCVADPGKDLVRQAHQKGIRVVPLVGPSSLMLALMASGFNGQNFAFVGYVARDTQQREKQLRQLEKQIYAQGQTQIMIETPYRNMALLQSIIKTCHKHTALCIACELSLETEYIATKSIAEWQQQKSLPDIHKRNTVFLLYK